MHDMGGLQIASIKNVKYVQLISERCMNTN